MPQKIGVVALPGLVSALADAGYDVITGDGFPDAAKSIRAQFQASGPFPVVVGDDANTHPSAGVWLKTVTPQAPVAVVAIESATGLNPEGATAIKTAPVIVGDLLVELNMPFPDEGLFTVSIGTSGGLVGDGHPRPAPVDETPASAPVAGAGDPWADSPPTAEERPASATPVIGDDPWADSPPTAEPDVPAPEPAAPAPEAEVPSSDPVDVSGSGGGTTSDDDDDDEEEFDFGELTESAAPMVPAPAPAPVDDLVTEPPDAPVVDAAAPETATEPVVEPVEHVTPVAPVTEPAPQPPTQPESAPVVDAIPAPVDTAPAPTVPAAHEPQQAEPAADDGDEDFMSGLDDLFVDTAADTFDPRAGERRGDVLIVMSAKGGVGKSTTSLNLAQYAAEYGPDGYRVALIDANRGQGDLRTFLRIHTASTPTVYDAARTGDPTEAVLSPNTVAQYRNSRWGQVGFAFVPAPPSSLADPEVVTSGTYNDVISHLRSISDLVVVDTQISEEHDTTHLWEKTMLPLLRDGAWCLAITEPIPPAAMNLVERMKFFHRVGVGRERIMTFVNRVPSGGEDTATALNGRMSQVSKSLSWVPEDPSIKAASSLGKFNIDNPNFGPVLAETLAAVTGINTFDPARHDEPPAGFFSRLLRRKGRS